MPSPRLKPGYQHKVNGAGQVELMAAKTLPQKTAGAASQNGIAELAGVMTPSREPAPGTIVPSSRPGNH